MNGTDGTFIEARFNPEGLEALKRMRTGYARFKWQRIKDVIQAFPSQTPVLRFIKYGEQLLLR